MKMLALQLLSIIIISLLTPSFQFYFVLNTNQKCFYFEQPKNTPIFFSYEILDEGHIVNFDLYYGEKADSELQILHKELNQPVDNLDYTTDSDGYFTMCVSKSTETHKKDPTRFKLIINYGYDEEYYDKLSKDQNYDGLNMEVHKLNDMMSMTLDEADFQKHKEVDFHKETEKMDNAALWWPMLQIGILVLTGIFQVQHLKKFFKQHKLI